MNSTSNFKKDKPEKGMWGYNGVVQNLKESFPILI